MTTTFEVVAEPTRRRILDLLRERSRPVGELVELFGLSQPLVSKHLRVLRDAGLVRVRQDAQRRWYELRPEPLVEVDAWLEPYRRLWADSLDALETAPGRDARRSRAQGGAVNATLRSVDDRAVLRMERRLAHPPEKVWRALTDPAHLNQWYPFQATALELRVGGRIGFDGG